MLFALILNFPHDSPRICLSVLKQLKLTEQFRKPTELKLHSSGYKKGGRWVTQGILNGILNLSFSCSLNLWMRRCSLGYFQSAFLVTHYFKLGKAVSRCGVSGVFLVFRDLLYGENHPWLRGWWYSICCHSAHPGGPAPVLTSSSLNQLQGLKEVLRIHWRTQWLLHEQFAPLGEGKWLEHALQSRRRIFQTGN